VAGVRLQIAQNYFQQCALARAVRPEQPNFVAALNTAGEILDQRALAIGFADIFQLRDQLAGTLAGVHVHFNLANLLAACRPVATQLFQAQHAPFVAGTRALTPWRIQTSSCANTLSNLAFTTASSLNMRSLIADTR